MTVWVLFQTLTPEEEVNIRQRGELFLPLDDLPDMALVSGVDEFKRMLRALYPNDPPETIARRVDKYWKLFSEVHVEDVIAVPLPTLKQVAVAEVVGGYSYHMDSHNCDQHTVPVKWHERPVSRLSMNKFKELFEYSGDRMFEVENKEARTIIRDCLPYSYNRFVKIKWLLALFFIWFALRAITNMLGHGGGL